MHEFGHYSNLAHTIVNGQLYIGVGDTAGPEPFDTFGPAPFPPFPPNAFVETMYPFYFGPPIGTASPEADDVAILSTLYPEPGFFANTGTISDFVLAPNGTTEVSGVNVIARNVDDPFFDAVSAISGDFTQGAPATGNYTINGLTPGATYAVYVDEIEAGGFSTTPSTPLPGVEEFWNGADESSDPNTDDPSAYEGVPVAAGNPSAGIDIIFNGPAPGDPLPVGDDGSVQLFLPFTFSICNQDFGSVFVNANGNLTFGAGDSDFSESAAEMLDGPPRIAGVWDDLNPSAAGTVFFSTTNNTFTVTWDDVPEFSNTGSNTFSIELKKSASQVTVDYGNVDAADSLAGVSCGLATTGDSDFSESLGEFENGQPRIAPLWDDLSPNNGGLVFYKAEASSLKVTFMDVPEFLTTGANNFSVTLDSSGDIDIEYGSVTALDGIVGVSQGGGVVSTPTDFSAAGGGIVSASPVEEFDGFGKIWDLLAGTILNFVP